LQFELILPTKEAERARTKASGPRLEVKEEMGLLLKVVMNVEKWATLNESAPNLEAKATAKALQQHPAPQALPHFCLHMPHNQPHNMSTLITAHTAIMLLTVSHPYRKAIRLTRRVTLFHLHR
jgi:hypothetical protein